MSLIQIDVWGENESEPPSVRREQVFEILSNRRRRHVLHYLRQRERTVELRELSTRLTAWENGTTTDAVTHTERKRLYTALRQTHLPKMDDAGVVEFDPARGTIEPTSEMADVELYLDVVPENEISRSTFYLGLSGVCAALVAASALSAPPFGSIDPLTVAAFIAGAFGVSSAVDLYYQRRRRLGGEGRPPDAADVTNA